MKFVILFVCVALAAAQSPTFPGQSGFQRFGSPYSGFPHSQFPFQQQPLPKVTTSVPKLIPTPAPPHSQVGIAQQYRPYHSQEFIPILKQHQDAQPGGGYQWDYQSANGITAYENAEIVPRGVDEASKTVRGGYSYTSLEGIPVEVTYTADENGFHPHVVVHTHGYERKH
ncbi:hypothetical protein RN001_008613 [Aquatica leii]|uniref:Uncharacterized protein n=1 Tax=Aquatica leii TaxID=1421715 RepID=A0AAN7P9U8_9COLE|nr:hypothetical protein RN001_008613 [Aquatica leii]